MHLRLTKIFFITLFVTLSRNTIASPFDLYQSIQAEKGSINHLSGIPTVDIHQNTTPVKVENPHRLKLELSTSESQHNYVLKSIKSDIESKFKLSAIHSSNYVKNLQMLKVSKSCSPENLISKQNTINIIRAPLIQNSIEHNNNNNNTEMALQFEYLKSFYYTCNVFSSKSKYLQIVSNYMPQQHFQSRTPESIEFADTKIIEHVFCIFIAKSSFCSV